MEALDVRALRSIPTPVADCLLARGCRTAGDVLVSPKLLQQCLAQLRVADAEPRAERMAAVCSREVADSWGRADSALQLLRQGQAIVPVALPCQRLSCLLGNALRPGGAILEVCGLPGTGKTQLCLQLCAAAQIPAQAARGDNEPWEAVYVDAEGSFVARRYAQICEALLAERRPNASGKELEAVLRRMHVCRTYDATELYSTLKQLGTFLRARPRVRALVVDSLAFCFRHEFGDNQPLRARVLIDIATMLRRYGAEHGLNVVVTNHMTTRFDRADANSDVGWLVPALGETWAHQPSTQLRLERWVAVHGRNASGQPLASPERPLGRATLTKSVEQAVGQCCTFRITETGLRDEDLGPG